MTNESLESGWQASCFFHNGKNRLEFSEILEHSNASLSNRIDNTLFADRAFFNKVLLDQKI